METLLYYIKREVSKMGRKATGSLKKARANSISTYVSVVNNPSKYSAKRVANAQAKLKEYGVVIYKTPNGRNAHITKSEIEKAYANYKTYTETKYGRQGNKGQLGRNYQTTLNYKRQKGKVSSWELASGDIVPEGTALNMVRKMKPSELKILKKYSKAILGGVDEVQEILRYLRQVQASGILDYKEYLIIRSTLLRMKNNVNNRMAIHDFATNDNWRLTRTIDLNGIQHNQKYLDEYFETTGGESHIFKGFKKWAQNYGITIQYRYSNFKDLELKDIKFKEETDKDLFSKFK